MVEIRDVASKFAQTISKILDVDVMIVDRTYVRVADTFRYVNDPPALKPDSVTGQAITTGKVMVVSDKMKADVCRGCSDLQECCMAQIIAVPIFYEDQVVGAIDLLIPFGKQSPVFENLELSIDFLERMADLLSSKLRNIDDYNKLDVIKKEREFLLDFIEDALVYTNESGELVHWNHQFSKIFNLYPGAVGRRLDSILDHPAVRGALLNPRSVSNQEFVYSDRNVTFNGFLSSRHIQKNGVKYGMMLIFKSMEKAFSVLNELSQVKTPVSFDSFVAADPATRELLESAKRLAVTDETVLVAGAPGTGKSTLIRAIHDFSDRAANPFVVVNCRGFSPEYLEEDIFGRGSEGDEQSRSGKLLLAQGGTVFFRHVEEMPIFLQKKLTRVIKAKKLDEDNAVAARLVFSADSCILKMIAERRFDEELAVRISRHTLSIPPLAERPRDAKLLVDHFIEKYERLYSRRLELDASVLDILYRQAWPGNAAQVEKTVEYLLSDPACASLSSSAVESLVARLVGAPQSGVQPLEEMEKQLILKALAAYPNKDDVARALQIGRATLYRKLKQYEIA